MTTEIIWFQTQELWKCYYEENTRKTKEFISRNILDKILNSEYKNRIVAEISNYYLSKIPPAQKKAWEWIGWKVVLIYT